MSIADEGGARIYHNGLISRLRPSGGDIPLKSITLIHLERVDRPIRVPECSRVIVNVILAAACERGTCAVLTPDVPGPVTAKSGVEDDMVVFEMLIDVAVVAADEAGGRVPPIPRVGMRAQDIAGFSAAGEEPNIDPAARPLHGVDTPVGIVEPRAVVSGAALGLDMATQAPQAAAAGEAAPVAVVHGHLVLALRIDALKDVNFAAVGPVGADHPEGGPGAADAAGHVREVEHNEAVRILSLARETHAGATAAGGDVGMVDAPGYLAVADVEEVH